MERTAATPAAASMGVNADEAHDNSPPEHAAHIFRQATPLDPGEAPVGCLPRLSPAGSHGFHGFVRSLLTHSRCHGAGDRQDEGSGPGCKGIILTPDTTTAEAASMDVLLVSRGLGKQALMNDEEVLWLIRNQAHSGRVVFSVCTGALLCGAPGISPRYDPSFTNRSGLCGLWSTLTPVIFATARVGQRVRLLVKAVERSLERNLTRGYRNREMVTEAQTTSCFASPSGPPPETSSPGFYSGIANLNFKALEAGNTPRDSQRSCVRATFF